MNAIQTEYKGYLFRSRLEARWAVNRHASHGGMEDRQSSGWNVESWTVVTEGFWLPRVADAYRAARQARFEHGASGR